MKHVGRRCVGPAQPATVLRRASSSAGECGVKDQVSCSGPPPIRAVPVTSRTGPTDAAHGPQSRLALVGPTASGKTALAVAIARRLGGLELVSVDAMAVYRGMDVGTAKPTSSQRQGLSWHLLDLVAPSEEFSVRRFQDAAAAAVAAVEARGNRVLLVGGTGLYHRAVIDSLDIPARYPAAARSLADEREAGEPLAGLHERLARLDPVAASRIDPGNERRILRALEVCLGSGRPFSSFGPGLEAYAPSPYHLVGLRLDRAELDARIESRFEAQLASGFVEEVARLLAAPGGLSRTASQALGYRELIGHVRGELSLAEARRLAIRRTRAYARRQESWFCRDPRVEWLDAASGRLLEELAERVTQGGGR